jgi:hypothetical protein
MDNFQRATGSARGIDELEMAPGICRGNDLNSRGEDVFKFPVLEIRSHFGLRNVVNPRAAAAPGRLGQLDKLQSWNGKENLPRLAGDFLAVAEVTCLMVGDSLGL